MSTGKHLKSSIIIKQLNKTISLKDKEINDIKNSLADIFQEIRMINESNSYSDPSLKRRKISELCTDTIYELLIDDIIEEESEKKIIELPITNHSNK